MWGILSRIDCKSVFMLCIQDTIYASLVAIGGTGA